ncbi:MAG: LysM peptidoglycan-binding domain-containing protein [Pirellulaceae bacterium]
MSKKRVLLGLSIIAGGVCASLPFLRETPLTLPVATDPAAASAPQAASPLLEQPVAAIPSPLASSPERASSQASRSPSPYLDDGSQRLERVDRSQAAPAVEEIAALPKEKSIAPPLLPVSFQVKEPEANRLDPWLPARLAEGPAGPPREYRIRKLDSLEALAERFLGSPERAEELFAANRGVLKDRHILPLGAVIRIPFASGDSATVPSDSDLQPVRPASER